MINIILRNFKDILIIDDKAIEIDVPEIINSKFLFFDFVHISYSIEILVLPDSAKSFTFNFEIITEYRFLIVFIIQKLDNVNSLSTFDIIKKTYNEKLDISLEIFTNSVIEEKIKFI